MIELFAEEVGSGYELGQLKGRRPGPGWPLEPDLRDEVARRAHTVGVTVSELIAGAPPDLQSAQRTDGVPFVGGRPPLPFSQTTLPAD